MKRDTSYLEYIQYDVLGHIPGITSRGMFSGHGIYLDGAIIALVIEGELYFKANKELKEKYTTLGYHPFSYNRNGKMVDLNYMSVTAEDLENRDEIDRRVEESYEVSIDTTLNLKDRWNKQTKEVLESGIKYKTSKEMLDDLL